MARSILITGSSHGIGAGCAIAFARDEQANIGICGNKNPEGALQISGGPKGEFKDMPMEFMLFR